MTEANITRRLASWAAGVSYDDIPAATRERTRVILLDALASAVAGRTADESPIVVDTTLATLGGGGATLVSGGTGSLAAATIVNGYLVTAVTVCDIHIPTVCHVTPEVVPPAIAVAEDRRASGRDLLRAIALGLEVTTRVGLGTDYLQFRERGWHSPGVTGPFGGATAVGSLLGFDPDRLVHAYGIAASQAAGTWAQLGTPTIKFQQARGAFSGLISALLAERGFTATPDALGADDGGLYSTYAGGGRPDLLFDRLGERWELENISLRSWPAAAYLQGVVTAVLALVAAHDVRPDDVEQLSVGISPSAYELHGERTPRDRFEARLTARYVAAVTLHDRACWMEQFTVERYSDPDLTSWSRDRVAIGIAEDIHDAGASIEVRLKDGRTISHTARVPKGDPQDAHTFEDAAAKLRAAAAGQQLDEIAEHIVDKVRSIEEVDDVGALLVGLRSPRTG
jgi:2-methylcitrate dehydratase PrpD